MAQALLLPVSVLLGLMLGADALHCRVCSTFHSKMPCMPQKLSCSALFPKEACFAFIVSYGGVVEQKILGCIQADHKKCGLTWNDRSTGRNIEYKCCSDTDYCNQ